LRDRLRDAAHEAILDAAEEAFARQGMDAPMETIASLAGVAVGTLYNHFDSRAALLEALLTARRQEMLDAAAAALAESQGRPFAERFLAGLRALVSVTEKQIRFRQMIFQADLVLPISRHAEATRAMTDVFTSLLAEGRKEGELAADPRGTQGVFLGALLKSAIGMSLRAPDHFPLSQIPEVVARQFLDGARAGRKP
jgi:AcrR family transcriptional regulator